MKLKAGDTVKGKGLHLQGLPLLSVVGTCVALKYPPVMKVKDYW